MARRHLSPLVNMNRISNFVRRYGIFHVLPLALLGVTLGVGGYTFIYAEGPSYLSDNPRTCVNCHIMQEQFDGWAKSSHHATATCVDCHLPHDFVPKYIAKSENGYHHSMAFTFQDFHQPIMIKPRNSEILQANCLRCHGELVHQVVSGSTTSRDAVRCVQCHASVGHGPLK